MGGVSPGRMTYTWTAASDHSGGRPLSEARTKNWKCWASETDTRSTAHVRTGVSDRIKENQGQSEQLQYNSQPLCFYEGRKGLGLTTL